MRRHIFLALFFFAAFTLRGAAQSAPCQSERGGKALANKQTSLLFNIDQTTYSLSQSLVIDVGITNDGPDVVYIYGDISWGYMAGLVLTLRDESGKEIAPVLMDDTVLPPPPRNDDPTMFIKLGANNFFGTRRRLAVTELVKNPGRYSLQVEYRSPLFYRYVDPKLRRLPALWHEDPSIFSKTIMFEVTP